MICDKTYTSPPTPQVRPDPPSPSDQHEGRQHRGRGRHGVAEPTLSQGGYTYTSMLLFYLFHGRKFTILVASMFPQPANPPPQQSVSADSAGPPERERLPPKSTLPALPKSSQGSAGSQVSLPKSKYPLLLVCHQEGGGLPRKYPTLEPIKGRDRGRRRKTHKTY